jgi:hypothetical protein
MKPPIKIKLNILQLGGYSMPDNIILCWATLTVQVLRYAIVFDLTI